MNNYLSVIVPIYNSSKTLSRCLNSILTQSYTNLEVICVNDGSTDNSYEILKQASLNDPRIKILAKNNGGLSSARNLGIDVANGDYICFVDSDDFIDPDMFKRMIEIFNEDNVDLVGCGTEVHYEAWSSFKTSDAIYYKVKLGRRTLVKSGIFKCMDVSVWNKMFKRSIIEKYKIRFLEGFWYEDSTFIWPYISVSQQISFIDTKFYHYIRYPSSIMGITFNKKTTKVLDHLKISIKVFDFLSLNKRFDFFRSDYADFLLQNLNFCLRYLPHYKKLYAVLELFIILKHIRCLDKKFTFFFIQLIAKKCLKKLGFIL